MRTFPLLKNECLAPGFFRFRLRGNIGARPGQFVMVKAWPGFDPLLARPFSVHDQDETTFSILFQVKGRGTAILATQKEGDEIQVLGPLGRGFDLSSVGPAILVAGGIGIAPFLFLAKQLKAQGQKIYLFYGAKTATELLLLDEFETLGVEIFLATEDGKAGRRGFVTEPLRSFLEKSPQGVIYACGPLPMLKAVSDLAFTFGLKAFLSLEARMACGLGMCLGCTVPKADGKFLHVCTEGPVVLAEEVFKGALP